MQNCVSALFGISLLLWGCGGPATPPSKDPAGSSSTASAADGIESERKEWMHDCVEQPGMEDFCVCAFDYVVARTTAEERKDADNPNSKKALEGLTGVCGKKLPKSFLKDQFVRACAKEPGAEGYCACAFEYLYDRNLLNGDTSELTKVEPAMKKACLGAPRS